MNECFPFPSGGRRLELNGYYRATSVMLVVLEMLEEEEEEKEVGMWCHDDGCGAKEEEEKDDDGGISINVTETHFCHTNSNNASRVEPGQSDVPRLCLSYKAANKFVVG